MKFLIHAWERLLNCSLSLQFKMQTIQGVLCGNECQNLTNEYVDFWETIHYFFHDFIFILWRKRKGKKKDTTDLMLYTYVPEGKLLFEVVSGLTGQKLNVLTLQPWIICGCIVMAQCSFWFPRQSPVLTRGYITNTHTQQCASVGITRMIFRAYFSRFYHHPAPEWKCFDLNPVAVSVRCISRAPFVHGSDSQLSAGKRMLL